MSNFAKKILSIIIGMLIATLLILIVLWLVNRSVSKYDFSDEKSSSNNPVSLSKSTNTGPEILNPIDLNNGVKSGNTTTDNQTREDFSANSLNENDNQTVVGNENDSQIYLSGTTSSSEQANEEHLESNEQSSFTAAPSKNDTRRNKPKPPNKLINSTKKEDHDAIGNLINEISGDKITAQRAKLAPSKKVYRVQIGSYQRQLEAEGQKARLIMMNIPSEVVRVNVNGRDYYRVVTARTMSREEAKQIKSHLKSNRIDSLIISQ